MEVTILPVKINAARREVMEVKKERKEKLKQSASSRNNFNGFIASVKTNKLVIPNLLKKTKIDYYASGYSNGL